MKIIITECKHCGTEYTYQASGWNTLGTPRKYQSPDHCPDCQKAIVETLEKIPVVFKNKWVKTNEVTLEQLLEWENKQREFEQEISEKQPYSFPIIKQVFAALYSLERQEKQIVEKVIGRDEFKFRQYLYNYWPSDIENVEITVKKRVNLLT